MRLRTVDLNLLVTLEALVAERSVSKAALRMGLTNWRRRNKSGRSFLCARQLLYLVVRALRPSIG
jgi:hypothetical protein